MKPLQNQTFDQIKGFRRIQPRKKKCFGQHFLRKFSIVENMINAVNTKNANILEIGPGDGFLTNAILNLSRCKKLVCVEVDSEWTMFLKHKFKDQRFELHESDILEFDFQQLLPLSPIILLANLPYNLTFPILDKLIENKNLFSEMVVMLQEEVAQRLVATSGKKVGFTSMRMQHHFEIKLLDKIGPESFSPPPKVFSRTIYLKPKTSSGLPEDFWNFLKICFKFPRQMLKNNLQKGLSLNSELHLPNELGMARAQHLKFEDFVKIWDFFKKDQK